MRKIIVYTLWLLIASAPYFSGAQPGRPDVTGVWKGELYVDSTKLYHPYEMSVFEDNGKLSAFSRISFEQKGIVHVVIRDHTVAWDGDKLIVEDVKQLSRGSTISQPKDVRKKMTLSVTGADSSWNMSGTWSTNRTRVYLAATGTVKLDKVKDFKKTALYQKLDSLDLASKLSFAQPEKPATVAVVMKPPPPAPEEDRYLVKKASLQMATIAPRRTTARPTGLSAKRVPVIKPKQMYFTVRDKQAQQPTVAAKAPSDPSTGAPVAANKPKTQARRNNTLASDGSAATDFGNRNNKTQQEVYFRSDSLQLTLYDNGEIDGDTVSVLMNGKVIIARQGLSTKANVHTIYIDEETPDSIQLVMYAENLGSIAPNTGLLVVKDGASVYEVRFSADLKTNAAIILRRRKD